MSLGFCDNEVYPTKIFIGSSPDCLWYTWDKERQVQVPIKNNSIICMVTGVSIVTTEYKGEDKHKFCLAIEADKKYLIQAGLNTMFVRSLLLSLCALSVDNLLSPLQITLRPGQDKTVWPSVFINGMLVKVAWDKDISPIDLFKRLQSLLDAALIKEIEKPIAIDVAKGADELGDLQSQLQTLAIENINPAKISGNDSQQRENLINSYRELKQRLLAHHSIDTLRRVVGEAFPGKTKITELTNNQIATLLFELEKLIPGKEREFDFQLLDSGEL